MAALVDTNVLVYRFDPRDLKKQARARDVEFVPAVWAYAECYGLDEIISEDFQRGRLYGSVRATNPFV